MYSFGIRLENANPPHFFCDIESYRTGCNVGAFLCYGPLSSPRSDERPSRYAVIWRFVSIGVSSPLVPGVVPS